MFRSRRAALVRRLWRSRLVTGSDARDEAGRSGACGTHPGKQRPVTRSEPEDEGGGDVTEREHEEEDARAMCVPEQDGDSRTVTCCLFGEWAPRRRGGPYWAPRKDGGGGGGPCGPCAARRAGLEEELARAAHSFLNRLAESAVDALARAVDTGAGTSSECVLVPRTELRVGARHVPPQYVACRLFRWSDLPPSARLKALRHCQMFGVEDSAKVCCNPHHYSRVCAPGESTMG